MVYLLNERHGRLPVSHPVCKERCLEDAKKWQSCDVCLAILAAMRFSNHPLVDHRSNTCRRGLLKAGKIHDRHGGRYDEGVQAFFEPVHCERLRAEHDGLEIMILIHPDG